MGMSDLRAGSRQDHPEADAPVSGERLAWVSREVRHHGETGPGSQSHVLLWDWAHLNKYFS